MTRVSAPEGAHQTTATVIDADGSAWSEWRPLTAHDRNVGRRGVREARTVLDRHRELSAALEAKARRLAADGVNVVERDEHHVLARVRGDHGVYEVGCDSSGKWWCTCASWVSLCSHTRAVARVVGIEVR
jgi:limonene-1,2-epoxide hydrolase